MLDTNLCIRLLRDRPAGLLPRFSAEAETLCLSTITLAELLHGAARSAKPVENRREVGRMAARLAVLDFDSRAAEHAGDIYAEFGRKGT
jgi:tRNA(fMet)-specific endonuclease VapC